MNRIDTVDLPDFSDVHILVIGDTMIDRYISGDVKRISPEAPVPVVEQKSYENRAGGAANVAMNILSLGAQATLLSICGADEAVDLMKAVLINNSRLDVHLIPCQDRKTTVKTRIMAGNQHLIRVDNEDKHDINAEQEKQVFEHFIDIINTGKIDGIILQDYNKGMLTATLIEKIMQSCVNLQIPVFVDPKEKNFLAYRNCTFFKPNKKEVFQSIGYQTSLDDADKVLRESMNHSITMITLGKDGLYLHDGLTGTIYPTSPRDISDVCGAGDSVISVACLCYIRKVPLSEIAIIANTAGGQVCESPGVVPVNYKKLKDELLKFY